MTPRCSPLRLGLLALLTPLTGVAATAGTLKIGIAQVYPEAKLSANVEKMLAWIERGRAEGCRVVVFPEGVLTGAPPNGTAEMKEALAAVRRAAARAGVYVIFGGSGPSSGTARPFQWAEVIDPGGEPILRYDKIYDRHDASTPGVFLIDGVPAGVMICADRWLRGVEELPVMRGAKISFELSNNFEVEWVDPLKWYWYVSRALRTNVWVVFANTGNPPGDAKARLTPRERRHGHSAVVAPDGRIAAAAEDDAERLLTAVLDPQGASRREALARLEHPALRPFWEAGVRMLEGGAPPRLDPFRPCESPEVAVKLAAAQMTVSRDVEENLRRMEHQARAAAAQGADLVAFPELAVTGVRPEDIREARPAALGRALERLCAVARENRIAVAAGMPHLDGDRRLNSAFVIGPDGAVLTRYDQLSARPDGLFEPGTRPRSMWFRLKGVPAIVTVGRDALWTELAEFGAAAGAQVHVHLTHEPDGGPEARLRRLQVAAAFASFRTFTAVANAASPAGGGSSLWEDLHSRDEVRNALDGKPAPAPPSPGAIYSAFSANCLAVAGDREALLAATRRVNRTNPSRAARLNRALAPWYELGARVMSAGPDFPP
jgi:predicted amidohydrolase